MSTKRILVIESDDRFAQSIVSMLSKCDVEVVVITDGKAGMDVAKENRPDLVLLSVELPNMSGYSICQKMKKDRNLRSLPLIVMSSEATEDTFEQHKKLKTRAEDYIIKPFGADQILPKIKALVPLEDVAGEAEEEPEIIALEDDEAISFEGDEVISFDEMESLGAAGDSENVRAEECTQVMTGSLTDDAEDLSKIDDVFDGLRSEENLDSSKSAETSRTENAVIEEEDEEIRRINDVLGGLDDADQLGKEGKAAAAEADLDFTGIDDLNLTEALESTPVRPKDATEKTSGLENNEPKSEEKLDEGDGLSSKDTADLEDDLDLASIPDLDADLGLRREPGADSDLGLEAEPGLDVELGLKAESELGDLGVDTALEEEPRIKGSPLGAKPPAAGSAPTSQTISAAVVPSFDQDSLLATRVKNTEEENQLLREKVSKLQTQIEEMHQSFERRESELGSLRTKTTSKDKEFLALKATINAKDREILDLKEDLNKKDQDILDVQEKVGEREEEIARVQETIAKRDREIKDLSDRNDSLLRDRNDMEEKHQALMADWDERYTRDTAELEHRIQTNQEEFQKSLKEANQRVDAAKEDAARLRSELDETKQRHADEVYGLRTRYRNEIDKLQMDMNVVRQQLDQTKQRLEQECAEHEVTRQTAARVPQLVVDLERARGAIVVLEQQVAELRKDLAAHEDRVVKAYQKIKSDEKIKEKARKAVEIAVTLLTDQVSQEERSEDAPISDGVRT